MARGNSTIVAVDAIVVKEVVVIVKTDKLVVNICRGKHLAEAKRVEAAVAIAGTA